METQEKDIKGAEGTMAAQTPSSKKRPVVIGAFVLGLLALVSLAYYFGVVRTRIYIEKSEIYAPTINLTSAQGGVLKEVYVNEGDAVAAHQPVARVGDELIKTEVAGIVTTVDNAIGEQFTSGQTVVTMVEPKQLRVYGHLDEDKGLDEIHVGDRALFSVDALSGKEFEGIVDSISEAPRHNDVVFSISDKREVRQFDVKVRFNELLHPEIKNGMSARLWVYVKQ